jgi:hypothetical protein
MVKPVLYISFWPGYHHTYDALYNKIFNTDEYSVNTIENHTDITEELLRNIHIIICGSFNAGNTYNLLEIYGCRTILYITEPIEFFNPLIYSLVKRNIIRAYIGCINNDFNKVKYPLYMMYMGNLDELSNKINSINNYLDNLSFEDFCTKEFCCMINSHDRGNTRSEIFHKLSVIQNVTSPGNLLNNYSNSDFEKEGRDNFQRRFIFGICSENFVTELDGYITEKIYLTCINGNIPIYYGKLDDIDQQIFNMNRVIRYNPLDCDNMDGAVNIVRDLMSDKYKLFEFYKQRPFKDDAITILKNMENEFIRRTNEIVKLI